MDAGKKDKNGKLNCWEFMKCGSGPESGCDECPVAIEKAADGLNNGINGGRICWVFADALCKINRKPENMRGESYCFQCEFRYKVMMEEGLLNVCNATGILLKKNVHKVNEPAPK